MLSLLFLILHSSTKAVATIESAGDNPVNLQPDGSTTEQINTPKRTTAHEMGYGIEAYECDTKLKRIPTEKRQVKNQGSVYRICFRPNEKAREDGIHMKGVESFVWEMESKEGLVTQTAVDNGKSDGILSSLICKPKICYLDTLLNGGFYTNPGSVEGYGYAHLTFSDEPIRVEKWMFQADFKLKLVDADGNEMSEEDVAAMMAQIESQKESANENKDILATEL